jgi:hypothetical protein
VPPVWALALTLACIGLLNGAGAWSVLCSGPYQGRWGRDVCITMGFAAVDMMLDTAAVMYKGVPDGLGSTGNQLILGLWGALLLWPVLLSVQYVYQYLDHASAFGAFCLVPSTQVLGDHASWDRFAGEFLGTILWIFASVISLLGMIAIGAGRFVVAVVLHSFLLQTRLILEPTVAGGVYWFVTGQWLDFTDPAGVEILELIRLHL